MNVTLQSASCKGQCPLPFCFLKHTNRMNCVRLGVIANTGASTMELPTEIRSGDLDAILMSGLNP